MMEENKELWHDLLDEFTQAFDNKPFFGGEKPDVIDFLAYRLCFFNFTFFSIQIYRRTPTWG